MPPAARQAAARPAPAAPERVGTLRGARVEVDARRAGRVLGALTLIALAVTGVVLLVVGAHKNDQIDQLRRHGVPVELTVSSCVGLLGGSGSNAAGYACRGTYSLRGHRYEQAIPGTAPHVPGASLVAVAVPDDPALFSTVAELSTEHASAGVYLVPAILLAVPLLTTAALLIVRRRRPSSGPAGRSGARA